MPKNVQMPDGAVVAFPDNMDDATIHAEGLKYINQVMQPPGPPSFAAQQARNASAVKPVGIQVDPNLMDKGLMSRNTQIDAIAGPAAATIAGASVAPFTGGLGSASAAVGANTAITTLLKQLNGSKQSTIDDLSDSAKSALLNEVGGRLVGGVWKAGKAFTKAGVPDAASMAILKPTAGQAADSGFMKWLENTFAPASKAAAQDRSARIGSQVGFNLAGKEAGRSAATVQEPNTMVKLITGELVPEESIGAQKILQRTADYQPIKIIPNDTTPGHYLPGTNTSNFDPKLSIQQNLAKNPIPLTQTQVTSSGVTQVPIPGAYEIIPGVVKKVPFATDPASLDTLLKDPNRLQTALTKSQAAGVGYNVRQDMAGYQLARIQQAATTIENGKMHIDTNALENEFNTATKQGADSAASNKILFKGSKNLSNVKQFYTNLAHTQDKIGSSSFRNMMIRGDGVILGMGLVHSALSGSMGGVETAAGVIGLQLGTAGLAKLLTTENSGRIMLALANQEALGVSEQYAARMISKSLTGTVNYLVKSDGSQVPVQFGPGGVLKAVGQ